MQKSTSRRNTNLIALQSLTSLQSRYTKESHTLEILRNHLNPCRNRTDSSAFAACTVHQGSPNRATTIQASPLLCNHVPKCVSPFSGPVAVVCLKIVSSKHQPLLMLQQLSASGTGRLHRSSSRCHPATGWISCASSIQQILVYSCLESRYRTDASRCT